MKTGNLSIRTAMLLLALAPWNLVHAVFTSDNAGTKYPKYASAMADSMQTGPGTIVAMVLFAALAVGAVVLVIRARKTQERDQHARQEQYRHRHSH